MKPSFTYKKPKKECKVLFLINSKKQFLLKIIVKITSPSVIKWTFPNAVVLIEGSIKK